MFRPHAIPSIPLLLAALAVGCSSPNDEAPLRRWFLSLEEGEQVSFMRVLEPGLAPAAASGVAAVVTSASEGPELRIYEMREGALQLVHATRPGDSFHDLVLEDVNANGRKEIVTTWEGGHLEVVAVIEREEDGTYRTLFQTGGREIERRYAPAGGIDFLVTSRTYQEGEGQPPIYESTLYRWDGSRFAEVGN